MFGRVSRSARSIVWLWMRGSLLTIAEIWFYRLFRCSPYNLPLGRMSAQSNGALGGDELLVIARHMTDEITNAVV